MSNIENPRGACCVLLSQMYAGVRTLAKGVIKMELGKKVPVRNSIVILCRGESIDIRLPGLRADPCFPAGHFVCCP